MTIITAVLAFFKVIPAITGGITAWTQAFYNAKVEITKARIGGDVTVAQQLVTGLVAQDQTRVEFLKVVSQSKFLMWIIGGFAGPWIVYEWKCVVWDNILCLPIYGAYCSTPEIKGLVGAWAGLIIGGIFGAGSVMAVSHSYFNRSER